MLRVGLVAFTSPAALCFLTLFFRSLFYLNGPSFLLLFFSFFFQTKTCIRTVSGERQRDRDRERDRERERENTEGEGVGTHVKEN